MKIEHSAERGILQHVKGYKHLNTKIWNTATFSGTIKK